MLILMGWLAAEGQQASACDAAVAVLQPDLRVRRSLTVSFRSDRLSIQAQAEPIQNVLREISRKTGIHFHYGVPFGKKATLCIAAQPVPQALKNLFGPGINLIVRYREGATTPRSLSLPTEVWVLGGEDKPEFRNVADRIDSDPSHGIESTVKIGGRLAVADGTLSEKETLDQLIEMTSDDDPAKRMYGLSALSETGVADESTIGLALNSAVADEDPSVRGFAALALFNRGGPDAMAYLWQALRDPDPSVRIMVVQSITPQGEGVTLLQEALLDADETVRSVAVSSLTQAGAL